MKNKLNTLRDILGEEEYSKTGSELDERLGIIKRRNRRTKRKSLTMSSKRKRIMDYLRSVQKDPLCQKYIKTNGDLKIGNRLVEKLFEGVPPLTFTSNEIYYRPYTSYETIPFPPSGYATEEINCGMGGSYTRVYDIAKNVYDIPRFKLMIAKAVSRRIGR